MSRFLSMIAFCVAVFCAFLGAVDNDTLHAKLAKIEGLTIEELPAENGYRVFDLHFRQPADHTKPDQEQFEQRLVLWHKDENRPLVLQTSGYKIFNIALSSLAAEFDANQIQVEHRFFADSIPQSRDWSLLNIQQSAADFHRITVAFKSIYQGRWVNTGRSKGGMTSVYHRRFYPHDVDATVAHVAPHSYSIADQRYADFLANNIGGELHKKCRDKLALNQRLLLKERTAVLNSFAGNFDFLTKEIAMEHAIIELPWTFWQYDGPDALCSNVPDEEAPIEEHIRFLLDINGPQNYTDTSVAEFAPYYFQAAAQLGNPKTDLSHINDLLQFGETFNVFTYAPVGTKPVYDDALAMTDITHWLKDHGTRMLFVYGEWDPWSGGAFEPNTNEESASHIFHVPQVNHRAQFIDLQGKERELAYTNLRTWLNLEHEVLSEKENVRVRFGKTLEDLEFEAMKTIRR